VSLERTPARITRAVLTTGFLVLMDVGVLMASEAMDGWMDGWPCELPNACVIGENDCTEHASFDDIGDGHRTCHCLEGYEANGWMCELRAGCMLPVGQDIYGDHDFANISTSLAMSSDGLRIAIASSKNEVFACLIITRLIGVGSRLDRTWTVKWEVIDLATLSPCRRMDPLLPVLRIEMTVNPQMLGAIVCLHIP